MHIGFTYDLKDDYLKSGLSEEQSAEFDSQITIDTIDETLCALGHSVDRIGNIRNLVNALSAGRSWDLVFNICEGLYGSAREAQVAALLDAYNIPYTFSDTLTLTICLDKGLTKIFLSDKGIPTAGFTVINQLSDLEKVKSPFPLFVKPVSEGTSKGIDSSSIIENKDQLEKQCSKLLSVFKQAVLVEEYLPGREFTVGITGTGDEAQVVGIIEVLLTADAEKGVYSYRNKEMFEQFVRYRLTEDSIRDEISAIALRCWKLMGCRDGGRLDFRLSSRGTPCLLEINPLAGLNPLRSDLPIICKLQGIPYIELIRRIVDSAALRLKET